MKTQFQVVISRTTGSKTLLSYEMALNVYDSIVLKANRGCKDSQDKLESIQKQGF